MALAKVTSDTAAQPALAITMTPVTISRTLPANVLGTRLLEFSMPQAPPPDLCLLHSIFRI